jgi:hypothetical protein
MLIIVYSYIWQYNYFWRVHLGGRDHIISMHYMDMFPSWRRLAPDAIYLTPETEVPYEIRVNDIPREHRVDGKSNTRIYNLKSYL